MLIFDFKIIGNNLFAIRKKAGLTQAEVAEAAGLSDRTYADIERGTVNMRVETLLRICTALYITPDDILTEENESVAADKSYLIESLELCTPDQEKTALRLLGIYLRSLKM